MIAPAEKSENQWMVMETPMSIRPRLRWSSAPAVPAPPASANPATARPPSLGGFRCEEWCYHSETGRWRCAPTRFSVEDALLQRDTRVLIGMQEFLDSTGAVRSGTLKPAPLIGKSGGAMSRGFQPFVPPPERGRGTPFQRFVGGRRPRMRPGSRPRNAAHPLCPDSRRAFRHLDFHRCGDSRVHPWVLP